ncbi:deoxyguanosinetriphosphate triphosphohydrolase family protein [Tabrizicola aquatica]|uniref:deoxyguanosinetriphosphate triphosphohydrolase family protein n=1 Tax=Tabrizicola aquatica TaxID=909926 RepID=UPI000CD0CD2A|nr:dNTP triphosphohydrolase [Tabrizicola aquatica]
MRTDRFSGASEDDQRHPFQRDHDRILYSSYFHRLAGVTQIVRAGEEDSFHTRQQHTHKVAQIGRRLAQNLVRKATSNGIACPNIDPEVVAAASLAHDLGHPPFGHKGEYTLNRMLQDQGEEGYEGNAQTFRIITKLAVRFDDRPGLDLTRAVSCAVLKYPWLRDEGSRDKSKKWSAYRSEAQEFNWARAGQPTDRQSLEAELMDWSDDIAYSVHDLEDFHRCNLIPWHKVLNDSEERERIISQTISKWHEKPENAPQLLSDAFESLKEQLALYGEVLQERYDGSYALRLGLRQMTSALVGNFILQTDLLSPPKIYVPPETRHSVLLLKTMARDYIIANPALAAQQKGQERIIRELFGMIIEDTRWGVDGSHKLPDYLPKRMSYLTDFSKTVQRFAADCISSLTEREATRLHSRLVGYEGGSVLDPIVR